MSPFKARPCSNPFVARTEYVRCGGVRSLTALSGETRYRSRHPRTSTSAAFGARQGRREKSTPPGHGTANLLPVTDSAIRLRTPHPRSMTAVTGVTPNPHGSGTPLGPLPPSRVLRTTSRSSSSRVIVSPYGRPLSDVVGSLSPSAIPEKDIHRGTRRIFVGYSYSLRGRLPVSSSEFGDGWGGWAWSDLHRGAHERPLLACSPEA